MRKLLRNPLSKVQRENFIIKMAAVLFYHGKTTFPPSIVLTKGHRHSLLILNSLFIH